MDFIDPFVLPGLGALMVVFYVVVVIALGRQDRKAPPDER